VLVGYQIARSITKPLSALVETAEAVSAGDLERRTTVTSQDEFGRLSIAFNQMTEHLLRLYTTSRELSTTIELGAVLEATTRTVRSLVDGTDVVALLDERGNWTYHVAPNAPERLQQLQETRLPADEPLLHELARDRQLRLLNGDNSLLATSGLPQIAGFQQVLLAPLMIQDALVGVLIFGHETEDAFDAAAMPTLTAVANMATSVLYNAVLFGQVHDEASERQAILQSIADGVVVCDNQRTIVLTNNAAQQMLGLPNHMLVRRSFDELPLERVTVADIFGEMRAGLEHYRINNTVLALSRAEVIVDHDRVLGEVIVLHDISAETAVDEAKTEFIATISHELRTPLTPIYGYIELLQRGVFGELSLEQREILDLIHMRAEQMKDLINNIVMVASIQSNTLATEAEPLDLWSSVESAAAPLRRNIDKKSLSLIIDIPEDVPQVLADREQLRLIITQLLDNARRYTTAGTISVRATQRDGMVQVDIEDTGPGIPPERLKRLFTRFHRIDGNSSQERGGGLGLAITRQLVERQGGQVWAHSEVGHGSTFSFSLPVANGHVDAVLGTDTTNTAA
jgi:signal transduction histidine kinase/HAMP domain-containing protein